MRSRLAVPAIVVVAVGLGLGTFASIHEHVLPRRSCSPCHGPTVHSDAIMGRGDGEFTGPDACEPCHSRVYHVWSRSGHCRSMMCPAPSTVAGHFSPDTVTYAYRDFVSKMTNGPNGYTVVAPGPDRTPRPYRVDLVVGIRDAQAFLTRFPDGRYQVLPALYDIRHQTWFESTEGIVFSDHMLRPGELYYWTNAGRTWNWACFNCHLSGMEKNYDPTTNTYSTTWRDLGIDCEACHGPGRPHARLRTVAGWRGTWLTDTTLVRLGGLSPRRQIEVCGECHASKGVLALGFKPGDDFTEFYQLTLLDHDFIMPDGRFSAMMYDVLALMQSPCFEKGGLVCTKCHDPHGSHQANDLRSFAHENEMCRPCHDNIVDNPQPHTFHRPDSTGSNCRLCHMPFLKISRTDLADHTIGIPVPENTIAYNSPNSCQSDGCHPDSSSQWAAATLDRWYGPNRKDRHSRARVLYMAKTMDRNAVPHLIAMLSDTGTNLVWRATAARMLGTLGDTSAIPALLTHAAEPDPLLRWQVVNAATEFRDARVEARLKPRLLEEPNSQIRLLIAGKLGYWWRGDVALSERERAVVRQTWQQYVHQVNTAQPDDPRARSTLGRSYMQRGEYPQAERQFTIVRNLDPTDPWAASDLGDALSAMRRFDAALARYREAVELGPTDAALRVNLAGGHANAGDLTNAERELRRALALEPSFSEPHRLLGQMLLDRGDHEAALQHARRAVELDSTHVEAQFLLGQTCLQVNRRDQAIRSFVNVIALDERSPLADDAKRQLVAMLPVGAPLPPPRVGRPGNPPPPGPRRSIEPVSLWAFPHWPDYTPRTTARDVGRLREPMSLPAALDSAKAWLMWADNGKLLPDARRAYAQRALRTTSVYSQDTSLAPVDRASFERLTGHVYAIMASLADSAHQPHMLAQAQASLDEAGAPFADGENASSRELGRSYYRLARAYNQARMYALAAPAFEKAAHLTPNSFTEGISWFFVGTSFDRLGQREKARAAYTRSVGNPYNSDRGLRCSRHALDYAFTYVP